MDLLDGRGEGKEDTETERGERPEKSGTDMVDRDREPQEGVQSSLGSLGSSDTLLLSSGGKSPTMLPLSLFCLVMENKEGGKEVD